MTPIVEEKLAKIKDLILAEGSHSAPNNGLKEACVMEAVSYISGEPWSDHPACACPVISAFLRSWNDSLPEAERNALLKPFITRLVDTKRDAATETKRSLMAADWLVRTHTPAWLRLAGLIAQAERLESLPEITAMAQVPSIKPAIMAVRDDAYAAGAAAGDAAGDAARAAARAAARDAAWAAAWAAARAAAGAAAGDAAWAAARAAAGDAAWAAARAALKPTVKKLQQSAVELIERMLAA